MSEACQACKDHWGGKLLTPKPDDPTPELGVLIFNEDTDDELNVDLLGHSFAWIKEKLMRRELSSPVMIHDTMICIFSVSGLSF
jgi:hypothetical protein